MFDRHATQQCGSQNVFTMFFNMPAAINVRKFEITALFLLDLKPNWHSPKISFAHILGPYLSL